MVSAFEPGGNIRIIGHRGAAGAAPENTLEAVRHGMEIGSDAIEVDVHVSACGKLVVIHDSTLERTTNGTGRVEALSFEQLRDLDAGYRFTPDRENTWPFRDRGVVIPTLDEVMEETANVPVIIEIKSLAAGRGLGDWLAARSDRERILIGGFSRAAVAPAARHALHRCATEEDLRSYVLLGKLGFNRRLPGGVEATMVPVRHRHVRVVTRSFVRRTRAQGCGVFVWTVNRPEEIRRLFDLGVDGIISDFPAIVRRVVEEREAEGRDLST
jgi:glycerophosphoryl diester phosphodiesterase